jgi:hypothetical protein
VLSAGRFPVWESALNELKASGLRAAFGGRQPASAQKKNKGRSASIGGTEFRAEAVTSNRTATLPSALFVGRLCRPVHIGVRTVGRCHLHCELERSSFVSQSPGRGGSFLVPALALTSASPVFTPSLPLPAPGTDAQFAATFCGYPSGSYSSPVTHNRCMRTASFLATATLARPRPFFPPRLASSNPPSSQLAVRSERAQYVVRTLHQQSPQKPIARFGDVQLPVLLGRQ